MNFRNNLTAFSWKLRNRGVEDILIAVVDGLKGFPEASTAVFPLASVQTCIVHLTAIVCPFAAGKNARPWRANSKDLPGRKRRDRRQATQRVRSWFLGQKISDAESWR
jgi:putative transposase